MSRSRFDWRDVRILYRKELRGAFRERSIVVYSILLPILLYPLILWIMFSAIVFVEGISEGFVSRVALYGLPAEHAAIRDSLEALEGVELREGPATADSAAALVRAGELDAVAEFLQPAAAGASPAAPSDRPAAPGADTALAALAGNFRLRLTYDRSEERSERARGRVEGVVEGYRDRWIAREARRLGIEEAELRGFRISMHNVATGEEMGAFILAEMIPLFLVIMVAMGSFYPAIDSTAGERERSTWETLMTVSASRSSIVTAKYLYVVTLGTMAGILNVLAMLASMGTVLRPLAGDVGGSLEFTIPAAGVPVMLVGALALALFFSAAMMVLASFARTFKDGQAMITPVYWLALLPMLLMQMPEARLTPGLAAVPILNVAVMVRDAITGRYEWLLIAETVAVGLVVVVACLRLAGWILRFEDFLLGSHDGSFWRFVKERIGGGGTSAGRERARTSGGER